MVSTWDGCNVLDKHSSSISEWITVHIGMYCIRMDNNTVCTIFYNEMKKVILIPVSRTAS